MSAREDLAADVKALSESSVNLKQLSQYCHQNFAADNPDKSVAEARQFAVNALTSVAFQVKNAAEHLVCFVVAGYLH